MVKRIGRRRVCNPATSTTFKKKLDIVSIFVPPLLEPVFVVSGRLSHPPLVDVKFFFRPRRRTWMGETGEIRCVELTAFSNSPRVVACVKYLVADILYVLRIGSWVESVALCSCFVSMSSVLPVYQARTFWTRVFSSSHTHLIVDLKLITSLFWCNILMSTNDIFAYSQVRAFEWIIRLVTG